MKTPNEKCTAFRQFKIDLRQLNLNTIWSGALAPLFRGAKILAPLGSHGILNVNRVTCI
jgi:hypothetical protein